ncbi:type II toxin-antitoxin system VapC family toxin [Parapedobacter sp. GCM10030251]|uniref:type II toxin-antitoxin system VapC family toxin n=1 Tax=Parapedobacter sp. GCM10030251 TaxID=3273419 RepID=UPI00360A30A5
MQYLLDTHAFLWFINGDTQLSDKARTVIENPVNDRYVSIASFWEMAIKLNLGKLKLKMSFRELYREIEKNGFNLLPITITHTEKIVSLDLHHRDPFDRMLICQALMDKLTIISADSQFQNYKVKQVLLWSN